MNLNKLFPRLTISAKLAIAFVLLALIPLVIVSAIGARSALAELRGSAEAALDHDMQLAESRTSRALREVEQHVTYVADVVGEEVLGTSEGSARALRIVETYLVSDPSPLFRFKVIDAFGIRRLVVDRRGADLDEDQLGVPEPLYRWAAAGLDESGRAILPIEVRSDADSTLVTPAIAVVVPVHGETGFLGAVVGEAEAEALFEGLDLSTPALSGGVTALADEEGRFLFHSEHKRDWTSLLGGGSDLDLATELSPEVAERIARGGDGALTLPDGRLLSHRTIEVGSPPSRTLLFYRTVPASVVDARIRQFQVGFGGLSILLTIAVLAVSAVAARQITQPIYALRNSARELTRGGSPEPLSVATNDELEDLANDFNRMAATLAEHRAGLESLVETRTSQLHKTEAHLSRIVTDATDAILALTPSGEITHWNRGAEALFGYTRDEVLGKPVTAVLGPTHGANGGEPSYLQAIGKNTAKVVNFRTQHRAKNESWVAVTVTSSEIRDESEGVVGHSLIIRDESARARLEEQMRRSERLSAISVMAGGIAHELNNPLSILGNRIELMQREAARNDGDGSMREDLEVLRKHVRRIGSVTSDLIKFARDDADELGAVDINAVVSRVTRLLRKVLVESGVELDVVTDDAIPMVLGSESVVEALLVNLLLNAQQATPAGGTVRVTTRRGRLERAVQIEVSDSGPGIPAELRRRVFEPFFTTKAEQGGTGLGLAVCRALVDRVGGSLELCDRPGSGATFVISLPRKVDVPS